MTPAQQQAVNQQARQDWQQTQQDLRGLPPQVRRAEEMDGNNFPSQQQAYNELVQNGQLPPRDGSSPPPASNGSGSQPATPPPVTVTGVSSNTTTNVLQDFNHDPTSDLIVPQIDLVPDLNGGAAPDGAPKSEVM